MIMSPTKFRAALWLQRYNRCDCICGPNIRSSFVNVVATTRLVTAAKKLPKLDPCRKPKPSASAGVISVTPSPVMTLGSPDEMGLTHNVAAPMPAASHSKRPDSNVRRQISLQNNVRRSGRPCHAHFPRARKCTCLSEKGERESYYRRPRSAHSRCLQREVDLCRLPRTRPHCRLSIGKGSKTAVDVL